MKKYFPVGQGMTVIDGFGQKWSSFHRGVDFARSDGEDSSNEPIYACASGLVSQVGNFSVFGGPDPAGCIIIDLDDGSSILYGHIVRDAHIRTGTRVKAGDRIGRINGDKETNGGVKPRLHFEYHPGGWASDGQVDPINFLQDAKFVEARPILYGIELSSDDKVPSSFPEYASYAFVRAGNGSWVDPNYHRHLNALRGAEIVTAACYYAMVESVSVRKQVQNTVDHIGDTTIPIAIRAGVETGDQTDLWRDVIQEFKNHGHRVILLNLPKTQWALTGQPDLSGFPPLWSTSFARRTSGDPEKMYRSRSGEGWDAYGGRTPVMWEFSNKASFNGSMVSVSAFTGDKNDLEKLFFGVVQDKEITMSQVERIMAHITYEEEKTRELIQQLFEERDNG